MTTPEVFKHTANSEASTRFGDGRPNLKLRVFGVTEPGNGDAPQQVAVFHGRLRTNPDIHAVGWLVFTSSLEPEDPIREQMISVDHHDCSEGGGQTRLRLGVDEYRAAAHVLDINPGAAIPHNQVTFDGHPVRPVPNDFPQA